MPLLQYDVNMERFHSQTCARHDPGSLCALILSAQKQTNKPTKGNLENLEIQWESEGAPANHELSLH